MKLYKKLFAVLMSAAMLLTLAFSGVSAEAVRTMPDVPDGYDGYAIVDFEAFVLGWGYIIEPTLVPYVNGETVADITLRLLDASGVDAVYSDSAFGFYLSGVACEQLANNTPITVPDYLAPELENNFGCYNDEGDGWYNPENGDGILSEMEYTYYAGWMYTDNNVSASEGAGTLAVEDGHVYRWMYSIYGYGMDVGISDGWGMFAPFDNPSYLLDRDAASTLYAEIAADPALSAMVAEGGQAYDEYIAFVETLTDLDSDQAAVDAALEALEAALAGGSILLGDVDGDGSISIGDALAILRHVIGVELLEEGAACEAADFNCDGSITSSDALLVLRSALGL